MTTLDELLKLCSGNKMVMMSTPGKNSISILNKKDYEVQASWFRVTRVTSLQDTTLIAVQRIVDGEDDEKAQ